MFGLNYQQRVLSLTRAAPFVGIGDHDYMRYGASSSSWLAVATSSSCCEVLTRSLGKDSVVFPHDTAYSASTSSYFSLKNSELHPSCVALPRSAQDVSAAIQTLSIGAHMWDGQCQFAIRGGGHTPFKGAASIDQGIVLDLLHLPTKGLSPDLGTVTVPPSLAWDMVYELLDEYSLSTLGTKVAGVGVGGAATSCVVLATGDIVNANATEHPRLWKALRGGINNFGVVTAVTLETFPQGAFWGGQTFHSLDTREQLFQAHADLVSSHPFDPYVHYINSLILTNMTRSWFVANNLQYTKSDPPVPEPKVFRPFLDVEQTPIFPGAPLNTIRVDNVTGFAREYADLLLGQRIWGIQELYPAHLCRCLAKRSSEPKLKRHKGIT